MLNDPNFAGVLEWMYNNFDCNNVLTPREMHRYSEIEQRQGTPTPEELDTIIVSIQNEYPGICLPGDQNSIEDVKMDICMLKEKLHFLEKQDKALKVLLQQNESTNELLNLEITKLNGACQQYADEEKTTAEECLKLAEEVEAMTDNVVDVIAKTMDVYTGHYDDKEATEKFFIFGPFEKYKQSQGLFQSHCNLYTSKNFPKLTENVVDYKRVLKDAQVVETRLSDVILSYIELNAELSGEQAKLAFVNSYTTPHSSQVNSLIMEAQNSVHLLEQEEGIVESQMQNSIKQYVEGRTALVEELAAKSALAVREEVHITLSHLLDTTQQALVLDQVLYGALRHELSTLEKFLLFATELRQYVIEESDAISSRIDSMNIICNQQLSSEQSLLSSDILTHSLLNILGRDSTDERLLVKLYNNVQNEIAELNWSIQEHYMKRVEALNVLNASRKPLVSYIWDGCTKQPNTIDKTVSSLFHALRHELTDVEKKVVEATATYKTVKNGDKQQLRKLWQWFLTDPVKLLSAMKTAQSRS
ncbi:hypothetical protein K1T71_010461 [Dendrolimus kikuchii]|uniref:Uncharacterized protein n=1 Tax=Dendrolimus kikuchii TaxID=765133 RepID=A0ACC1CRT2_9NEOP|nr:hypothetical protein K1T71_010461 [Dendrolimus kikuchii]